MMRRWVFFGLLCVNSVMAAEQQKTVPESFRGEWHSDLKNCTSKTDDTVLKISAKQIQFHESSGVIKAIVTQGASNMALIVEMTGEGESWLDYKHFNLSADHHSLTDITDDEHQFIRYKCPKIH